MIPVPRRAGGRGSASEPRASGANFFTYAYCALGGRRAGCGPTLGVGRAGECGKKFNSVQNSAQESGWHQNANGAATVWSVAGARPLPVACGVRASPLGQGKLMAAGWR